MKIFITSAIVIIALFFFGERQCSTSHTVSKRTASKTTTLNILAESPHPPTPEPIVQTSKFDGWKYDHTSVDPVTGIAKNWMVPEEKYAGNPKPFPMSPDTSTGFRVVDNSCLVEFKPIDEKKPVVCLYLDVKSNIFYRADNGIITDRQIPADEFEAVRKGASQMRFKQIGDKAFRVQAYSRE